MKRFTAVLVVSSALLVGAAAPGARAPSPDSVYLALLRSEIRASQLPAGFSLGRVRSFEPSSTSRAHHAVGGVEIEFNGGSAAIVYVVFPTRADALADWAAASRAGLHLVPVPPGLPKPALRANGSVSENHSGKTVRIGFTVVAFADGYVIAEAATRSATNAHSGDIAATIKLARVALSNLEAVRRRLA